MALDFFCYSWGLVYASVCTSLSDEEATHQLNLTHPTGVSPWKIADEPFRSGQPNPLPCERNPQTHRHILFNC